MQVRKLTTTQQLYLVIDCESIGLYGETYAVGWVLVDQDGKEMLHGYAACPSSSAKGEDDDRTWVNHNVDPHLSEPTHATPREVRNSFWSTWIMLKEKGALLVADCAYPVETNFISACVNDDLEARKWNGPYPLLDVSNFLLANDQDPLRKYERMPDELPEHHPTSDARQSARIFITCMRGFRK